MLGLATALAALGIAAVGRPACCRARRHRVPLWPIALGLIAATSAKLVVRGEARPRLRPVANWPTLRKTALLLAWSSAAAGRITAPPRGRGRRRPAGAGHRGGGLASPGLTAAAAVLALAASIAGEMAERYLFFTAVVRPKMPGGLLP